MFKTLVVLTALITSIACALGSTISGHFTWLSGTLAATVTGKQLAQTVYVKVGAVTHTIPNTYVTGLTTLAIGTPFAVLESGSQPFTATYTVPDCVAINTDGSGALGRRTIPTSSTGVLSANIGFMTSPYFPTLGMLFPECSIGALDFRNGIVGSISLSAGTYSFTIPTASVPTLGSMVFPAATPVNTFAFSATGAGALAFSGLGTSDTLWVTGAMSGTSTIYTSTTLTIGSNTAF